MTRPGLVAFLNARLDDDDAAAKAALPAGWMALDGGVMAEDESWPVASSEVTQDRAVRVHIARHDPARVLREVEAKRRILARYEFARNQVAVGAVNEAAGYGPGDDGWQLREDSHDIDVRDLAAVYSDHPDYDKDWA